MKVLILTHEFPPHSIGGIATFSHDLAGALARDGLEVTVVAGSPKRFVKADPLSVSGTNPRIIRVATVDLPPSHLWYQLMNLNTLQKLIPTFDIVHGQDASSFPLVYLSKRKHPEVPWVITLNTGPVSELHYALRSVGSAGPTGEFLRNGVGFPAWDVTFGGDAKFADALVPVSENLSMEIKKRYAVDSKKLFTIHPGVDIRRIESIARNRKSHYRSSGNIRLFWAGRFNWRKGILQLLEALAHLVHDIGFKSFELEVFGKGPLERRVRELVSRLGLSDQVRLRGFVEYEELIASMASADIVCFPSLYEACPSGMIEAMSLGKPILSFKTPFSKELLGDHSGLPVATNTENYARCLHLLCTSKDLRQQCQAYLRARARDHFDITIAAANYEHLYRKLLS